MNDTEQQTVCGLGIRSVAMVIDSFVWFALLFVAVYAIALPIGQLETGAGGVDADLQGGAGAAALVLWLGLAIGYHTLAEWRVGSTVGKYLVNIRVVKDSGTPLSLRSSAIRNVVRLLDWFPVWYVLGIVVLVYSDENKRLGDRIAGTKVVQP